MCFAVCLISGTARTVQDVTGTIFAEDQRRRRRDCRICDVLVGHPLRQGAPGSAVFSGDRRLLCVSLCASRGARGEAPEPGKASGRAEIALEASGRPRPSYGLGACPDRGHVSGKGPAGGLFSPSVSVPRTRSRKAPGRREVLAPSSRPRPGQEPDAILADLNPMTPERLEHGLDRARRASSRLEVRLLHPVDRRRVESRFAGKLSLTEAGEDSAGSN